MKKKTLNIIILAAAALLTLGSLSSCSKGWKLDYARPAAQFHQEAVLEKAPDYIGKKITIKGVVTKQDLTDPQNCMIYLGNGIACNFGDFKAMAEDYKVGDTVFIDGFLKRCKEGDILLEPATGRDPQAPFHPVE